MEPGASVTGANLLENQHAHTKTGFEPTPQNKHIHYEPRDYRHQLANLIRFVSFGMREHGGAAHLPSYFRSFARMLSPDGLALVHSIGVSGTPWRCIRWINEYILPGGYLPSLEQVTAAASR